MLGMETEPVKSNVRAFWELARQEVLGAPTPEARLWALPQGIRTSIVDP
jgi:hypothetical protein